MILICLCREYQREVPPISVNELERRVLLEKKWALYKRDQRLKDIKVLDCIAYSQQKALDELRKESEELYLEAIQVFEKQNENKNVGIY